jgi:hypothetical protein
MEKYLDTDEYIKTYVNNDNVQFNFKYELPNIDPNEFQGDHNIDMEEVKKRMIKFSDSLLNDKKAENNKPEITKQ